MNISILFTDEFMEAVRDDKEYTLRFHVESTGENIERTIRARDFFREFCETQWDWGDPGALFSDRLNDYHLLAGYDEYQIEITNPCGEFGGNAYNACNLGSINLYNMIDDKFGNAPSLNEENSSRRFMTALLLLTRSSLTVMKRSLWMKTEPALMTGALWGWDSSAWPMHLWR